MGIFANYELASELERAASFIESYSATDYDALVLRADGVGDTAQIAYDSLKIEFDALTQALADAKAEIKNPASLRLLVSELESRCRKADEAIQQCRTYLRGCMNHAFDETPIVEVAKDVSEEFHRNRYQIQCKIGRAHV